MVLVRNHPTPVFLSQPDGQPQSIVWIITQFLLRGAAQQGMRVRDVLPGGDVEGDNLEAGALLLPGEERRPGVPVGIDPAYPVVRRRNVEHHDVLGVIHQYTWHVALVDRLCPFLEQLADHGLVIGHQDLLSRAISSAQSRPRWFVELIGAEIVPGALPPDRSPTTTPDVSVSGLTVPSI